MLLSERLSGRGIVTALNMATGVPVWEIEPALGLVVGALLAAGIYPVIRRMGARVEEGKNLLTEHNRHWKDSFQVILSAFFYQTPLSFTSQAPF